MNPLTAMPGTKLRACETCGKFYEANTRALTCSEPCRHERWKRKHAERQREARRAGKAPRAEYHRQYDQKRAWPRCGVCGVISRKLPSVGCLECYARKQPPRKWNDDEAEVVEMYAGKDAMRYLQYDIYRMTGRVRSYSSIRHQVRAMGIRLMDHQDGYTINRLVEITGKDKKTIIRRIEQMRIENIARGRKVLISLEDGQRIIDFYKSSDKPSYSVAEVTRILGFSASEVYRGIAEGIPTWKEGGRRRVCKVTIDRAAAYLRKTGKLRIHWRLLVKHSNK